MRSCTTLVKFLFFNAGSCVLASSKASEGFSVLRDQWEQLVRIKPLEDIHYSSCNINDIKNHFQTDQYESCLLRAWGGLKRRGALGTEGVETQSVTSYFHQVSTKSLKFKSTWQDVCQPWAELWCRGNLAEFWEIFSPALAPLSDGC